jgi:hypothetical protein
MTRPPNFDRIARPYRWLEYFTLGPLLVRTRNHHLQRLAHFQPALNRALILGDGDGRFTARLLAACPELQADAVDLSLAHFFLDCLERVDLELLVARIAASSARGTLWLVSDFRIPPGPAGWPARVYVRMLYLAFNLLTGLRVRRLPDFASALHRRGFTRIAKHRLLFGMLTTELWQR